MLVLEYPFLLVLLVLPFFLAKFLPASEKPSLYVPSVIAQVKQEKNTGNQRALEFLANMARQWLPLLIWSLLVIAIARPQILGESINFPKTGRSLMLAIDVSGSMKRTGLDSSNPRLTRLKVLKTVANEFLEKRLGDRIGLIIFGTHAYLQTPLTFDIKTVVSQLNDAEIGIAGEKTAIGETIGLAIKRLGLADKNSTANFKIDNSVLILLTDGVNSAGEISPQKAAELAKIANLKIYTIGIGSERSSTRELDEPTLRYIADFTGGQYFRANSRQSLKGIYDLLNELEPVEADQETFQPVLDIFYIPLLLATLLSFVLILAKLFPRIEYFSWWRKLQEKIKLN